MIHSEIIHVTMFLTRRNQHFWCFNNHINAYRSKTQGCVQIRRDFDKLLCKKSSRLSWIACANKLLITPYFSWVLQNQQKNYKVFDLFKVVSNHLRNSYLCMLKHVIENKMSYSESEADSNFVINSALDSDSDSGSESDSNSVFMNLVIFVFFILHLHSSK